MASWAEQYEKMKQDRLQAEQANKNKNLGFSKKPKEESRDDDISNLLNAIPDEVITAGIKSEPDPDIKPDPDELQPQITLKPTQDLLSGPEPTQDLLSGPDPKPSRWDIDTGSVKSETKQINVEPYNQSQINAEPYNQPQINQINAKPYNQPSAPIQPVGTGLRSTSRPSQQQDPNDPWFQAYEARKQAALKNLEEKKLQSVAGASAFCGKIDGVAGLTKQNQVTRLMKKLKKEEKAPAVKVRTELEINKLETANIKIMEASAKEEVQVGGKSLFSSATKTVQSDISNNRSKSNQPPNNSSNSNSYQSPNNSSNSNSYRPPNPPGTWNSSGQGNNSNYHNKSSYNSSNNFNSNRNSTNNSSNYNSNSNFNSNGRVSYGSNNRSNFSSYSNNSSNNSNNSNTNFSSGAGNAYSAAPPVTLRRDETKSESAFRSRPPPPPSALVSTTHKSPSPISNKRDTSQSTPEHRPGRPGVPTPGRYGTKYGGAPSPGPNPSKAFDPPGFVPPTPPARKIQSTAWGKSNNESQSNNGLYEQKSRNNYQNSSSNYNNSSSNYQNSSSNYQNSSSNYQNSSSNYQNSSSNYQNSSSNYKNSSSNFKNSNSNNQNSGQNYQNSGSNYQNSGPNYQNSGPNYQNSGPNYQNSGPNYQDSGPNYQNSGPNYQNSGPNYQKSPSNSGQSAKGSIFQPPLPPGPAPPTASSSSSMSFSSSSLTTTSDLSASSQGTKRSFNFTQSLRNTKVDSKKDSDSWQAEYEAKKRARLQARS